MRPALFALKRLEEHGIINALQQGEFGYSGITWNNGEIKELAIPINLMGNDITVVENAQRTTFRYMAEWYEYSVFVEGQ